MKASRAEITGYFRRHVEPLYGPEEARRIALMTAAALSGDAEAKFLADPYGIIEIDGAERAAAELAAGRPVQYVLGEADFCGMRFAVREGVLIPRPETEELVMWAVEKAAGLARPRILDVCTGSGCIAIALARRIGGAARVTAIDISDEALAVARRNAAALGVEIGIAKDDALGGLESLNGCRFDIIVSNPPYIPRSEMAAMHENVTRYEPHMALFVDDDDPLIFYRAIARAARRLLTEEGSLLFEVHELLAEQTAGVLRAEGFARTEIRKDCFDKQRMICGSKDRP